MNAQEMLDADREPATLEGSVPSEPLARRVAALLAFEAPYLEDKLLSRGSVPDRRVARALFQELKKYLFLSFDQLDQHVPMFSRRVDETWHQFALFTRQYAEFCQRFAGRFLHHAPREAPAPVAPVPAAPVPALSFSEFQSAYEAVFGSLSEEWLDHLHVRDTSQLSWSYWVAPLHARKQGEQAALLHGTEAEQLLCSTHPRALDALHFIATHHSFFVRELPGLASERQRADLCRPLVQFKILGLVL